MSFFTNTLIVILILADKYHHMTAKDNTTMNMLKFWTTKYTERNHSNTEKIREHILAVIINTPGHVAFFSPSYALMGDILGDANWLPGHIRII